MQPGDRAGAGDQGPGRPQGHAAHQPGPLPGRYLVYVPNGRMTGISEAARHRAGTGSGAAQRRHVPGGCRRHRADAAEGATEEQLAADVARLAGAVGSITEKTQSAAPSLLSSEPDLAIRVVRDIFNEDFAELIVAGTQAQDTIGGTSGWVAPGTQRTGPSVDRSQDVFAAHRIDEQIAEGLDRKGSSAQWRFTGHRPHRGDDRRRTSTRVDSSARAGTWKRR